MKACLIVAKKNGAIVGGILGGGMSGLNAIQSVANNRISSGTQPQDIVDAPVTAQEDTQDIVSPSAVSDTGITSNSVQGDVDPLNATPGIERGFSQNIRTDENMNESVRESFETTPETYTRLANSATLSKAESIFNDGTDKALTYLNQKIGERKLSPEDVPLARMVANQLAQQGNIDGARNLLSDVGVLLTEAGQLAQAANILRNADPASVEQTIKKALDRINQEASKYS
jgi:hypothetical protein